MPHLIIHHELVTLETAAKLISLCPFAAITYENSVLDIGAGCKMCSLCVTKGPEGVITKEESAPAPEVDKSLWRGIAVYADVQNGALHPVTLELLGKAQELAKVTGHPVYAVLPGYQVEGAAQTLLRYGADRVYVYDAPELKQFSMGPYANALEDFIQQVMPSAILVGATNVGRSLAPRVAARFRTGLTADCTVLEMKENTDLVQIRPAFGGNIMAQIITPKHRPQFCTVRYKIFSAPEPVEAPTGEILPMRLTAAQLASEVEVLALVEKSRDVDISDAEVIVAVGRGVKSQGDLAFVQQLADALGAQLACTRPLIEAKWFDAKRQIGLSGRTVAAKLIITVGISGAVQFAAGMRGCERIIAVNTDPTAPIFDVAHVGLVGDLYEILPQLLARCKEEGYV